MDGDTVAGETTNFLKEQTVTVQGDIESRGDTQPQEQADQEQNQGSHIFNPPEDEKQPIFEHFLIIGISPQSEVKSGDVVKPHILFKYPPNKEAPDKVAEFCFPNGVSISTIKRSASGSSLNELLYGQPHLHSSGNSHVFVLSGESTTLYGCCVTKKEFLRAASHFMKSSQDFPSPPPKSSHYLAVPRCYCLLSKVPFFSMHFEVLLSLLAQDRFLTLTKEMNSDMSNNDSISSMSDSATQKLLLDKDSSELEIVSSTPQQPSKTIVLPVPEIETQSSAESKPLVDILDYYYAQQQLKPGHSTALKLPGDTKPKTYYCPLASSQHLSGVRLLADWCLVPLFMRMSLDNILKIYTGLLQEYKIVFISENLNILSAAVLGIQPLLHPFIWQGIFVPILPINLQEYMEAPVPFIIGVQALTLRRARLEAIIVDLDNDSVVYSNCTPPAALPEHKKLQHNLAADHKALYEPVNRNHNPFNNGAKQLASVHSLIHTLQAYIYWFIKKIEDYFDANPAEISDSLSVDVFKQNFTKNVSSQNREFVKQFLDTQLFSFYMHSSMGPRAKLKKEPLG